MYIYRCHFFLQELTERPAFVRKKMAQVVALVFVIDYPQKVYIDVFWEVLYTLYFMCYYVHVFQEMQDREML